MGRLASLAIIVGTLVVLPQVTAPAVGGDQKSCCKYCGDPCTSCSTELVPCWVTEIRMKTCIEKKTEVRKETYTVFKRVPETRKYKKTYCYLADEIKNQTVTKQKCHIVKNEVVRTKTIQVPELETRTKMVKKQVCADDGSIICVEEPCETQVTVLRPKVVSENCVVPDVVISETKTDISYCVKVPKMREEVCAEETVYKLVPVTKTREVEVCVPVLVKKAVEVRVKKMIPKQVTCCNKCKHGHGHGH